MNTIEKALIHALFLHLHHNIDKAIDFEAIEALNDKVSKTFPNFLMNFIGTRPLHEKVIVGPCGFDGKCTCGKCIERQIMEATLAAFRTGKVKACSDLGAEADMEELAKEV